MSFLTEGMSALNNALPDYEEAEIFYEGNADEKFTSVALQKALGGPSSSFNHNYARIVVESRLNRMEISSITTEDGSADNIISDIWNHNQLDQEIQDALEAALVYGDSYLIGWEGEDGFDVFYNDPMSTRIIYEVENPRKKKFAIKRWMDGERLRVNIYTPEAIEKYISKGAPTSNMRDGDFEQFLDDEDGVWPTPNPTGEIPVFHLRTARQYGEPEHRQAYGPQNSINKLLTTQISSIDFVTAPQRYFLQDPAATDGVNPQNDFAGVHDSDDDPVSNLKAGPGGVWNLSGIKSVGQFDAPSPDIFISPFKTYVEAMSTLTSTPMHAFNVGALPSGESLRAAEAPLNKRVASLELLFGGAIADLHEFALSFYGVNAKVLVSWAPAATYDDSDIWETAKRKTDAGVPVRQALMEAGYTDEQVRNWYPDESVAIRTSGDLVTIGDAMTKIASAVTLGILSREEARALLPQDILIATQTASVDSLPEVAADLEEAPQSEAGDIAEKADALGVLIRAGVEPAEAAKRVGLDGITFTGATPSSLRLPTADAAKLEEA